MAKQTTVKKEISPVLDTVAQTIYDKKGFNILALNVKGISSLADYVIIAEGNIDRHLRALSIAIKDALSEMNYVPLYIEGENSGDWIVMDYGEISIHLFIPEFREKYALEELWGAAKIIDVNIDTKPKKV